MKKAYCIFFLIFVFTFNICASITSGSDSQRITTSKPISPCVNVNVNAGVSCLRPEDNKTTLFGFAGDVSGAITFNLTDHFFFGAGFDNCFGWYTDNNSFPQASSSIFNLRMSSFSILAEMGFKGYKSRNGNIIGICFLPGYNFFLNGIDIGIAIQCMAENVAFDAIRVMYTIAPEYQFSRLTVTFNALGLLCIL